MSRPTPRSALARPLPLLSLLLPLAALLAGGPAPAAGAADPAAPGGTAAARVGTPGVGSAADTAPGRLTVERYMDMEGVSGPRISPDGERVVYTRQWMDPVTDSRRSALWVVGADGSRNRFLVNGHSPRWSPSGDRLLFLACGTPGGDPGARAECPEGANQQVWVRIMEGRGRGSVTQVTRLTEDAKSPSWSPGGERIAFTRFAPSEEPFTVDLPEKPEGAEWTAAPRVVDEVWYRRDGRGYLRDGHDEIFVVPATGGTPRQVTRGFTDHEDIYGPDAPQWGPNGETIYLDGLRAGDADYRWSCRSYACMESEIWAVDVATGSLEQLTDHTGTDRAPRISPDGETLAFTRIDSTERAYSVYDVWLMGADGSNPRPITQEFDRTPGDLMWAPDGSGVYFTAENHGTEDLYFAPRDGSGVTRVTEGRHTLEVSDLSASGTAVGVLSTPTIPEDVAALPIEGPGRAGETRRLTRVNRDVLSDVELGEVEEFRFRAEGGPEIQGWAVKPPGFEPGKRYPTILSIHGGPHAMYDWGFDFGFQNWAANGYLVLYVNPRGSTGYGQAFGNAIDNAWPGPDFRDLMAGVDAAVERGWAREDRLYVEGCSGGGTLTAWTVGHTDRFAAAVARCPISDWLSFVGTVDGPYWYNQFDEYPWVNPEPVLERSPLMYAEDISTPTLLMTGVKDMRTPITQTEELYQALKMERVPTKMIRMQDEWHGTGSNPSNFIRTQLYTMKWFERWSGDR